MRAVFISAFLLSRSKRKLGIPLQYSCVYLINKMLLIVVASPSKIQKIKRNDLTKNYLFRGCLEMLILVNSYNEWTRAEV